MSIFEFQNYKEYVRNRLQQMPKKGHGQYRRMANFLSVNSVNVSQIFKGDRDLSIEQACALCEFFGFSELESEYFVGLVEFARAGTPQLKKMLQRRLEKQREMSLNLKDRLGQEKELTDEARAIFYSNWYYSGIRLLSSIDSYRTPDAIAAYFNLPLAIVNQVLSFLVSHGLCVEDKGKFRMGPASTHLEAQSNLVSRHHNNWRVISLTKLDRLTNEELCLTLPCSLSETAFKKIRQELVQAISRISDIVDEALCHRLACLNIDWIKI